MAQINVVPKDHSASKIVHDHPLYLGNFIQLDNEGHNLSFSQLGWAFLLTWAFCLFYTKGIGGFLGLQSHGSPDMPWILQLWFSALPTFMCIVVLFILVACSHRINKLGNSRCLFALGGLAATLSTPLLFVTLDNFVLTFILFSVGSILTGLGSGLLWLLWGRYYAQSPQEHVEKLAPYSAVLAALLLLIISAMSGWVVFVVVCALPIACCWCLYRASVVQERASYDFQTQITTSNSPTTGDATAATSQSSSETPSRIIPAMRTIGKTCLGLLAVCSAWSLGEGILNDGHLPLISFQIAIVVSIVFSIWIAFASTSTPRSISVSSLYRWMCPMLVVCYLILGLCRFEIIESIALAIFIAVRFAFCLVIQMYFAQLAAKTNISAMHSFGIGKLFVNAGDFIGITLVFFVHQALQTNTLEIDQIMLLVVGIFFIVTVFVLSDTHSFIVDSISPAATSRIHQEAGHIDTEKKVDNLSIASQKAAQAHKLTPRETEILDYLAQGRSVPYIRDVLMISRQTVATHVKHIYAKLNVHSKQELIDLVCSYLDHP